MEQILRLFASFSLRQKITLALAAVAVAGGLLLFLRWNKERDFQLLYSNLAAEDASAVVARLKETGVEYRLSQDGASVKVPSARIPDLRLQMAGAGLPKSGRIGFELFDKTNFGATEFTEQINYHRALEGELERSVMALAEIEKARVHLTQPKESVFLENRRPAKASVLVTLRTGTKLSPQNVQAIVHLVSSAVEGLAPEMVTLLDVRGNLLNRPRAQNGMGDADGLSEAMLDYRRTIERDLLGKIHNTLEPLLGPEKYRAGVSVECDLTSGEQSEESFDPGRSVMTASQRTEDVAGAGQPSGVPGTASNLPRPTSRPGLAGQGVTRRTENIAYASSRLVKRTRLPQGAVKRVSVAVLLDHQVRFEGTGAKAKRIVEPPSAERLKATRELVSGVVGLQVDRGDQIIVETLPFESTLSWTPPPSDPAPGAQTGTVIQVPAWILNAWQKKDMVVLGSLGGGLLVVLLMVLFLLIKLLRRNKSKVSVEGRKALVAGAAADRASLDQQIEQQVASQMANRQKQEAEILSSIQLKLPAATTKKTEVLAKQLAEISKKDPGSMVQVVKTWMSDMEL